jgi:hypothetical protein
MTEDFIDVYGNYAIKLLRLQNDMIQTFDRYSAGQQADSRGAARPHTFRGAGSGRDHKSTRRSRRGCARMRQLQALLAVQIIATGFAGLRFLRQSHRQMTEGLLDVYGGYAIKLLRLQNEMIQTFERYRRGNKQTVEVRHVHIHSGGQGVVGIINPTDDRDAGVRE